MHRLMTAIVLMLAIFGLIKPAWAEKRVALVIGNGAYEDVANDQIHHVMRRLSPTCSAPRGLTT